MLVNNLFLMTGFFITRLSKQSIFIVKNSMDVRAEISLLGVSASSYLLEIM